MKYWISNMFDNNPQEEIYLSYISHHDPAHTYMQIPSLKHAQHTNVYTKL